MGANSSASMNQMSPDADALCAASWNCATAALRLPGAAGYSPASTCTMHHRHQVAWQWNYAVE